MPKQRSTRTVADVKARLQGEQRDDRGQPDNTPNPKLRAPQPEGGSSGSTGARPDGGGHGSTGALPEGNHGSVGASVTNEEGVTETPELEEAKQEADAPLTVEEKGKTSTVAAAQPSMVPRRKA